MFIIEFRHTINNTRIIFQNFHVSTMSNNRTILSRPRTKIYDSNYNIGESYYKSALDRLDRKYSGRPLSPPRQASPFLTDIADRHARWVIFFFSLNSNIFSILGHSPKTTLKSPDAELAAGLEKTTHSISGEPDSEEEATLRKMELLMR